MSQVSQAKEKDPEITPQYEHKKRLIAEEQNRKDAVEVAEQFLNYLPDPYNKKGGKYRLCKRMKNGNVYSQYLGRENQIKDVVKKYRKQGLKIIVKAPGQTTPGA